MSAKDDVSTFLRSFTKAPQIKVINSLADKPEYEFTKTDMASRSGIGRTTLYRIWDDLERMKAITPSRKVGAVTLFRLNLESPIVQSLLSIRDRLQVIETAVNKIEDLHNVEEQAKTEFGPEIPTSSSLLLKLLDLKATSPSRAVPLQKFVSEKQVDSTIQALLKSGLVQETDRKYSLTSLGILTAEGAAAIWRKDDRHTIGETLSSLKVALDAVSGDIKKLSKELRT